VKKERLESNPTRIAAMETLPRSMQKFSVLKYSRWSARSLRELLSQVESSSLLPSTLESFCP